MKTGILLHSRANAAEIPQRQPVAQPAKHHERNDIARQQRAVQDAVVTLVELPPPVLALEPTSLCCRSERIREGSQLVGELDVL